MLLTPSDPDISTLIRKIEDGRLDLQPNFQRGEVWGRQKKQRLIDSILRGWHIPPIHVIQLPETSKQEVLDGQQRLAAIRDFFRDEFPIDGDQEPYNLKISQLDGQYYSSLHEDYQAIFKDFTIRILTISNYEIGEPGELFYRLNQPTNLTSAEQRNAYFGQARQQVKQLVELLTDYDFNTPSIGFSNSRMAYDDVIAKCLITIEEKSLSTKVTANLVTSRYRSSAGFSDIILKRFETALHNFSISVKNREHPPKLNKATFYSWLLFYYQIQDAITVKQEQLDDFFDEFEEQKSDVEILGSTSELNQQDFDFSLNELLLDVFIDRSSSRVADVSSVKLRDFVLWKLFATKFTDIQDKDQRLRQVYTRLEAFKGRKKVSEKDILEIVYLLNWEGHFS